MKTITREDIQKARTYMPLREKQEKAEAIAQACVRRVTMRYREREENEYEAMPDRYQLSQEAYQLCLMQVLVRDYLRMGGDEKLGMPENEYDQWGESHVMNQLERMKFDKEVGPQAFDLLYDFKDFRYMAGREVEILLGHENDVVTRLNALMSRAADPEALESSLAAIAKMRKEIAEQTAGKE